MMQARNELLDKSFGLFDRGMSWNQVNKFLNLGMAEEDGSDERYLLISYQPAEDRKSVV